MASMREGLALRILNTSCKLAEPFWHCQISPPSAKRREGGGATWIAKPRALWVPAFARTTGWVLPDFAGLNLIPCQPPNQKLFQINYLSIYSVRNSQKTL